MLDATFVSTTAADSVLILLQQLIAHSKKFITQDISTTLFTDRIVRVNW